MNKYVIIKGDGRTMWLVRNRGDRGRGGMRFYSKRECETWIARAERADKEAAEWKIAQRAYRLDTVNAYLAKLAERGARGARVAYPTQFAFNF